MSSPDDRGPASRLNPTDRLLSMEFDSSALGSTARARDSSNEARGFRARSGDDSTGSLNAGSTGSGLSPDKLKFYDDIGLLDTNHESGKALTGSQVDDAALVAQSIAKPQSWKRWIILVLATLAIFGPYYSFDNPAGTAETVSDSDMLTDDATQSLACTSWPIQHALSRHRSSRRISEYPFAQT